MQQMRAALEQHLTPEMRAEIESVRANLAEPYLALPAVEGARQVAHELIPVLRDDFHFAEAQIQALLRQLPRDPAQGRDTLLSLAAFLTVATGHGFGDILTALAR
jgi:hypothetical protein